MSMTTQSEASKARARRRAENRKKDSHATAWKPGFLVKLVLMALVNALGVYIVFTAFTNGSTVLGVLMTLLLLAVDWVYFSKRTLALKYLAPGLVFLIVFQAFTIVYTGYIAFTNYGHQHTLDKEKAISSILMQSNSKRVEGSPQYPMALVVKGDELGFAVLDDGVLKVGTAEKPLEKVKGEVDGKKIISVDGWEKLPADQLAARQNEITTMRVPLSDEAESGTLGTQTGTVAFQFTATMHYDEAQDAFVSTENGKVYKADDSAGFFRSDDGETLGVGWRVNVGFANFVAGFSDGRYAQPFLKVLIWNVLFAFFSVMTTFLLGMILAIVMNDQRIKGRKIYRTIMLLPYAFPSFMTAFLFAGLLNSEYGFFNQLLGTAIPWLTDPTMAKVSVILVNLWMGFPYMFLIVTGALQAIPGDLIEAAKIDGASTLQVWRNVTLPQLMVALTPLLIASFAFNFNNFNLIYMLTRGGPSMADASVPVGHTDILISMVYKIAGLTGDALPNYGLAAAMSLVIFVIVGGVSLYSFKKSNSMEGLS
ncbi:ABC transporter permease subunit [Trueperella sp. LYQ143]|uniref:ABC transporter permease subunit n=1 Tax=unclassified Trueperella TaxID=2630174 RepID=UPI00398368BD